MSSVASIEAISKFSLEVAEIEIPLGALPPCLSDVHHSEAVSPRSTALGLDLTVLSPV